MHFNGSTDSDLENDNQIDVVTSQALNQLENTKKNQFLYSFFFIKHVNHDYLYLSSPALCEPTERLWSTCFRVFFTNTSSQVIKWNKNQREELN